MLTMLDNDKYIITDYGRPCVMDRYGGEYWYCEKCEELVPEGDLDDRGWCEDCVEHKGLEELD